MWTKITDYITNLPVYFITSLIIMTAIIIFSIVVGLHADRLDEKKKTSKFMTMVISFIEMINKFVKDTVGKHWKFLTPIVIAVALYIFISNISGVVGATSPTRFTTITFSMSLMAFVIVQMMGFVSQGWKSLLGIFKPIPAMFPLNIISEFTPILSMALRLFGNIASGTVILTLIYRGFSLIDYVGWVSVVVAPVFHLIFDIGFGFIQTLVFVLLIVIFSSNKVAETDFDIA